MCGAICKAVFGVLGWVILGAAIGAAAAGLYGVLCATLYGLIHGDPWGLASAALYFALCGAVAGAVFGGFVRMTDPVGVADLTIRSPQDDERKDTVFQRPRARPKPLIGRW